MAKDTSGKLADSWAMDYSDYPSAETFSFKSGDVFMRSIKKAFMSVTAILIHSMFQ